VLRKNVFGHSWLKATPDEDRQTFNVLSKIDPSTVYPIWSAWDDLKLDAVLVAYRKSARMAEAQWPGVVKLDTDGLTSNDASFYNPSTLAVSDADRSFVWVEDFWIIDEDWELATSDGPPIRSIVKNVIRVNGKIVESVRYPGWTRVPYFLLENENERDHTGFSDVGTMLPFQSALNQFMSEQADVIHGESRPKFKHRGMSEIHLSDEGVINLDDDEDIEQIAVHLDVFPTQIHGQQLQALQSRASGLPPVVYGEIQAAQNSGRALSTAWRATASRMVPRVNRNSTTLDEMFGFWVDCMELYNWNSARELFQGNRDFELKWPNQEPRDFQEITLDAINKLQAGLVSQTGAMELIGDESPDETLEDVRSDYIDTILHPEKAQSYLSLEQMKQAIAIQAQQAQIEAVNAEAQLAQMAAQPPGGAPSGAGGSAAAAEQARTQAAQEGAPQLAENQNAPATQGSSAANGGRQASTLIQDGGDAMNRIITKTNF
jgi:hypothetical protein